MLGKDTPKGYSLDEVKYHDRVYVTENSSLSHSILDDRDEK